MSAFRYRFAGFIVLVVLLLLGVSSDPALMNSDESDDDTVVVAVEMDLATPYETIATAGNLQLQAKTNFSQSGPRMGLSTRTGNNAAALASAPLIVPLRT